MVNGVKGFAEIYKNSACHMNPSITLCVTALAMQGDSGLHELVGDV